MALGWVRRGLWRGLGVCLDRGRIGVSLAVAVPVLVVSFLIFHFRHVLSVMCRSFPDLFPNPTSLTNKGHE